MIGSPDLYDPAVRGKNASVNFMTCHDGFTLYDLYSYNVKHNEANGWNNTDGSNDNRGWNCGVEGPTDDPEVLQLRKRMIWNACATLMVSRGVPMFLAGDEFGNTQFGNNNAYCQDNEVSWLDWELQEKNQDIWKFFQYMIHFRKNHPSILGICKPARCGLPEVSLHGEHPWKDHYNDQTKVIAAMYAGYDSVKGQDDIVYVIINAFWEPVEVTLPTLPAGMEWKMAVDTGNEKKGFYEEPVVIGQSEIEVRERTVMVVTAYRYNL